MNNFIPPELKDLTESKQRVMRNVVNEIGGAASTPKHSWRYAIVATLLSLTALLFVLDVVKLEEKRSAIESHIDFSRPTFSDESGTFFLLGITIGDSRSHVIERLGEEYTIVQEEESAADLIMDYEGKLRVYFKGDDLRKITMFSVNHSYFNQLFNDYDGFTFFLSRPTSYNGRYLYSKETNQIIEAPFAAAGEHVQLSLYVPSPDLRENAEYLMKVEDQINNHSNLPTDVHINFAKPEFSADQGRLFLQGVTLGDSPSKVIEQLGDNYVIGKVDGDVETDFTMDFDDKGWVTFYHDTVDSIGFRNVDKKYFEQLYNDYDGFKFVSSPYGEDSDRFFYSKETGHALKGTTHTQYGDLSLSLSYPDPNFWEHPEMKDINE